MAIVPLDRGRRVARVGLVILAVALVVQHGHGTHTILPDRPRYSPPRTPWGDPDIQGAYTNSAERGIPLERPPGLSTQMSPSQLRRVNEERREAKRRAIEWELTIEPPMDNSRGWLVIDPPDGRMPPLVSDVFRRNRERIDAWKPSETRAAPWLSMGPFERCISRGLPGSMIPFDYGNLYEIVQAPSVVSITYEMVHEARVIPLDSFAPSGAALRSYMGDPRGHFEGETLVIETSNFADKTRYLGASPDLRLIERFTPISATVLEWSVTFDDSRTWAAPWTIAMNLTRTNDRPLEYACHEGNRAVGDLLNRKPSRITDPSADANAGGSKAANQ